jgi:hypothetical protein
MEARREQRGVRVVQARSRATNTFRAALKELWSWSV